LSEGFVLDLGHANSKAQQKWVEGEPTKSFWFGLDTSDRESFRVRTYRCGRCGYLESYAKDSVD
jgi:hypothetical protein